MRGTIIIILVILFIAILIYLLRRAIEDKIYQPKRKHIELAPIPYKDLYLSVADNGHTWTMGPPLELNSISNDIEHINVWYLNKYPGSNVVLYFHGNSDNISYRQYMIDICDVLSLNLLLVDYRGYGRSDGEVSAKGIIQDAETAYNFLTTRVPPNRIIVWGESLGGTPALWIASTKKISCILLLSTFSKLTKFAPQSLEFFMKLLLLDVNRYTDNIKYARNVKCPILICHSKEDELIPYIHAQELYEEIPSENKYLVNIKGGHLSPTFSRDSFTEVVTFIRRYDKSTYPPISNEKMDYIINIIKTIAQ